MTFMMGKESNNNNKEKEKEKEDETILFSTQQQSQHQQQQSPIKKNNNDNNNKTTTKIVPCTSSKNKRRRGLILLLIMILIVIRGFFSYQGKLKQYGGAGGSSSFDSSSSSKNKTKGISTTKETTTTTTTITNSLVLPIPIPVIYLPVITTNQKRFIDGINESPYLQLIDNNVTIISNITMTQSHIIWLFAHGIIKPENEFWVLHEKYQTYSNLRYSLHPEWKYEQQQEQQEQQEPYDEKMVSSSSSSSSSWRIRILDDVDHSSNIYQCYNLTPRVQAICPEHDYFFENNITIPYWKRSIVDERYYNTTTQTISTGNLISGLHWEKKTKTSTPTTTTKKEDEEENSNTRRRRTLYLRTNTSSSSSSSSWRPRMSKKRRKIVAEQEEEEEELMTEDEDEDDAGKKNKIKNEALGATNTTTNTNTNGYSSPFASTATPPIVAVRDHDGRETVNDKDKAKKKKTKNSNESTTRSTILTRTTKTKTTTTTSSGGSSSNRAEQQQRRRKLVENWKNIPSNMPLYYAPISVRTDMVQILSELLHQTPALPEVEASTTTTTTTTNLTLSSPIEEILIRTLDVAHYWPPYPFRQDEAKRFGKYRTDVSRTIVDFGTQYKDTYTVFANIVGSNAETGRIQPQVSYLKSMLNTKIVIVTQRDAWEDHYRLFEALISGAMVMTDTMLGLPTGLLHGESIIEYTNLINLQEQLVYYLHPTNDKERIKIAKRGRYIAMNQHRTWHRMEEIIFGTIQSTCDVSWALPECPYTVHPI